MVFVVMTNKTQNCNSGLQVWLSQIIYLEEPIGYPAHFVRPSVRLYKPD